MSSINRKSHRIKREKTMAMPRHILFFDTETKPIELENGQTQQILKLGVSCYWRRPYGRNLQKVEWQDFYDADTFWRFVFLRCEPKKKLWCVARNLTFDFTVLEGWKYLKQAGYKVKFFHNKGLTAIISVRGNGHSIVFVDSLNWFKESIAETGKRIGLPKLKIDFETCTDEYLLTYCHRDIEIEFENFKDFIRFLEGNYVSRLCYTIGSTSMAAYLLNHYDGKIFIHNNKEAIDLERASYKGGRVECFYIGEKNDAISYILDVNSLYPSVMVNNDYPIKYKKILHSVSNKVLKSLCKDFSVVGQVLINTDEPAYAIRRERTIFPIGKFWTVLTTPELKYAFARGHILAVGDCVLYEQADVFTTFVNRFYALRNDFRRINNKQFEQFSKYMLNSFYGKWGQKAEVWTKIGDCPDEPDRVELLFVEGEKRTCQIRYLLGEIFMLAGYEESFNSFPAISAHVTAYGRLYLWDIIKEAGIENVMYCDTDSVIVNEAGLWKLRERIDETSIGHLKIEQTSNTLSIKGLKDYSVAGKSVLKGISKNALRLSENVYQQEKWPSFRGTLRSGDANVYTIEKITKVLTRKYTKGHVDANGLVAPFVLDESAAYPQRLF